MHQSDDILSQGIAALKAGKKKEAEMLLKSVVEQNPQNVEAWLWLGASVPTPDETLSCLERVLELDPDNPKAQAGVRWARSKVKRSASEPAGIAPQYSSGKQDLGLPQGLEEAVSGDVNTNPIDDWARAEQGTSDRLVSLQSESTSSALSPSYFFPNLIIAVLVLTLLLGIMIIIALLKTWLG